MTELNWTELNWTEMPKSQSCSWSSRRLKSKSSCKCDKEAIFVFRMLIVQQNLAKTWQVDNDWLINTLFIISLANIYWNFLCASWWCSIELQDMTSLLFLLINAIHCISVAFFPSVLNIAMNLLFMVFLEPFLSTFSEMMLH